MFLINPLKSMHQYYQVYKDHIATRITIKTLIHICVNVLYGLSLHYFKYTFTLYLYIMYSVLCIYSFVTCILLICLNFYRQAKFEIFLTWFCIIDAIFLIYIVINLILYNNLII